MKSALEVVEPTWWMRHCGRWPLRFLEWCAMTPSERRLVARPQDRSYMSWHIGVQEAREHAALRLLIAATCGLALAASFAIYEAGRWVIGRW